MSELGFPLGCSGEVWGYIQHSPYAGAFKGVDMNDTNEVLAFHDDIAVGLSPYADSLIEHIKVLQSRLESLEKDAARLDWMDKVGRVSIERVREGHIKGPLRWDVEHGYDDDCAKSKKSMRDAIDTLMKG